MAFKTSQAGVNLIKSFEGCRLTAYHDSAGVCTIGYGHTSGLTADGVAGPATMYALYN